MDISAALKRFAIEELEFDLIGVTTAEPVDRAGRLSDWVATGCHGEMAYMEETVAVRTDPRRFLRGANSVVCVAMSYHEAPEPPEIEPRADGTVVVARYARRADYHKVIKRRLVRLGRRLAALAPGARWRVATDAEPLLERELAQRAGLGWIGKNTCLINRRFGSELLLGELVTDVRLAPDEPEADHCGRCIACLRACPTAALPEPRRLDARRCISYLTIEHGSAIPDRLLPALGSHLFGCDICQAVCPWNRRAPACVAAPLGTRRHLAALTRTELEALDEPGWLRVAAGSPLRRIGLPELRRNLAATRGNRTRKPVSEP